MGKDANTSNAIIIHKIQMNCLGRKFSFKIFDNKVKQNHIKTMGFFNYATKFFKEIFPFKRFKYNTPSFANIR